MNLYIHSVFAISAQSDENPLEMKILKDEKSHHAIEPNYSEYITPAMVRRMSRVIKMGVAAGKMCLKEINLESPDAIISATGFGCFEDSVKFLDQIIENKESILSPTPFIQSTHNTVAAQIALMTQCQGYNNTHVHGGLSFENAVYDAFMYSTEHPKSNILLGAADELTETFIELKEKADKIKSEDITNLNLGEGASFFTVSAKPEQAIASIKYLKTMLNPDAEFFDKGFEEMLSKFNLKEQKPSVVLNGISNKMNALLNLNKAIQSEGWDRIVEYKKLCGEYYTSSAFALWLACRYFKTNPETKDICILNSYNDEQVSMFYLQNEKK